ncbi:unnamed protein product [Urochloa humidicola]
MEGRSNTPDRQSSGGGSPEEHGSGAAVAGAPASWRSRGGRPIPSKSIFNSGMFNPPKNETLHIRKLLERFGLVNEAAPSGRTDHP